MSSLVQTLYDESQEDVDSLYWRAADRIEELEAQVDNLTANYSKASIDLEKENFELQAKLEVIKPSHISGDAWDSVVSTAAAQSCEIESLQKQLEAVRGLPDKWRLETHDSKRDGEPSALSVYAGFHATELKAALEQDDE